MRSILKSPAIKTVVDLDLPISNNPKNDKKLELNRVRSIPGGRYTQAIIIFELSELRGLRGPDILTFRNVHSMFGLLIHVIIKRI